MNNFDVRKIAVVVPSPYVGGCENYAADVARYYHSSGHKVVFVCSEREEFGALISSVKEYGIQVSQCECYDYHGNKRIRLKKRMKAFWHTWFLFQKKKYDVIIVVVPSPLVGAGVSLSAALCCSKSVKVFQLAASHHDVERYERLSGKFCRFRGQKWVAVSKENAFQIGRIYRLDPAKIKCIYNGANVPENFQGKTSRQELGFKGTDILITHVGALVPQKNHNELIKIFKKVQAANANAHLLLIGKGKLKYELEVLVKDLGIETNVHFMGYRTDVADILAISDVFVFTSVFEGFPFALVEAMQMGLPIVTSNTSSMRELVLNGSNGFLYDLGDVDAGADALICLVNDPVLMRKFGKHASSHGEQFSKGNMLRELDMLTGIGSVQ